MDAAAIAPLLEHLFPGQVTFVPPGSWQVDGEGFRLLVLLSETGDWLRLLLPLAPVAEVAGCLDQLLAANFDETQEVRYALHQEVIWLVYQHGLPDLAEPDLKGAIATMLALHDRGLDPFFRASIERQLRQIVRAARQQNQSLEATLQTLDRFYAEGILGNLGDAPERRAATLAAWKVQLERLWDEAEEPT